ncbi:hypothetical protein [Photobacterium rosenbergii]|nr:hypothetical protein [Photobacterium rosenbergii]
MSIYVGQMEKVIIDINSVISFGGILYGLKWKWSQDLGVCLVS